MRNFLFFALLIFVACQNPTEPASEPDTPKAVFIILDGIPADVLEQVETPVLDEIAGENGYTRAYVGGEKGTYNETPTISAPGYMNLLTATWANKHNVWNNYKQSPNYSYWNIFRIAEQHDTSLQTAIFSTWLDNRTVLVGEGAAQAGDFTLDYAYDGFETDTVRFPHDEKRQYILDIDELVTDEAGRYIREKAPDLSWVYLEYTDDMGHAFGDSEEMYRAVRLADAQVGKVWSAIKERATMNEDWMIFITTDHGRDSISGKGHGNQSLRERTTWMVTNADDLNERFTDGEPPVIDIMPSILSHLGISAPETVRQEMDGISLVGKVSLDHLQAQLNDQTLELSWQPIQADGEAQILLAFANDFQKGQKDTFREVGKAAVADGKFEFQLSPEQMESFEQSGFLKVLVKGPHNWANYWIVNPPQQAESAAG
ncbi:alkaline phosphatase family protein [Flavilitoribacter nigricans]|uniref:Nucleotide pyrophosphatase n=1 Tax=Flavilitoribacter nigricans (strain ATCC 23147 / DSM 23189 / NBRC 102662 / NCIMB 1420 / SS-2) TaxID=1122177 RepID=A0A2D0N7R3_FLAN2|nr:alkaline phosphatase family protein [Flavilitoribacter nigricans]PHN04436.1 nucleotide pyrophosphatase [Flavilitoribacter nigricans DSM 23189 = NBRC 102662]